MRTFSKCFQSLGIEPSVILYIYCMVDKGKSSLLQNIVDEIRRGLIKGGALIKGGGVEPPTIFS